jgi:hypothetical protein
MLYLVYLNAGTYQCEKRLQIKLNQHCSPTMFLNRVVDNVKKHSKCRTKLLLGNIRLLQL